MRLADVKCILRLTMFREIKLISLILTTCIAYRHTRISFYKKHVYKKPFSTAFKWFKKLIIVTFIYITNHKVLDRYRVEYDDGTDDFINLNVNDDNLMTLKLFY